MNGMGTCVSEGILDIRIFALFNADGIIHYWEKHKDIRYVNREGGETNQDTVICGSTFTQS